MVRIAKHVPCPRNGAGAPPKYPWLKMQVEDSFLFPPQLLHPRVQASQANKRYAPRVFATRTTRKGVRCWRIK